MDMAAESEAYASAIWWACDDGTWCKLGEKEWQCLRPGADGLLTTASTKPKDWRPWTRLLDESERPYVSWFRGARANIAASCVDAPALQDGVAYEAVSTENRVDRLTRAELLRAVLTCLAALRPLRRVRFLATVRDADAPTLRVDRGRATIEAKGRTCVTCDFARAALVPLDTGHVTASYALEDFGKALHYRRCASVGLWYAREFACVDRTGCSFSREVPSASICAAPRSPPCWTRRCRWSARGTRRGGLRSCRLPSSFFEMLDALNLPASCIATGRLTQTNATSMRCDVAFRTVDGTLVATLQGAQFAKVASREAPSTVAAMSLSTASAARVRRRTTGLEAPSTVAARPVGAEGGDLRCRVLALGAEIVGAPVDPAKPLFDNGLHSLRAVEFAGALRHAFRVALDASTLVDADFDDVVAAVRGARTTVGPATAFAHVDRDALQRIVDARLRGKTHASRSLLAEAARGLVYMARRGLLRYLLVQRRDGLFRFLRTAPPAVDLERVVVVPGPAVTFGQTDYNRHFTVREIVRDSERGFYNLVHASGLAHLEHYYGAMFFASRLEAKFDAELLAGEAYEMRCRVARITGPLVDVSVAFHSHDCAAAAFAVTWRLMLVVDPRRARMYDFERGGVPGGDMSSSSSSSSSGGTSSSEDSPPRAGAGGGGGGASSSSELS